MSRLYLDLAIVIFFLAALIFVAKIGSQVDKQNKSNFDKVAAGISLLALMSVMTAIQNQLAAYMNSWQAGLILLELLRLSTFVVGLIMITIGISKWIPILKSNKLNQNLLTQESEHRSKEFSKKISDIIITKQTVNEMLVAARSEFQKAMPVDFISMGLISSNGDSRGISIGLSGTILNEIDVSFSSYYEFIKFVCQTNQVTIYADISQASSMEFPELFTIADIKSLLALPLRGASKCQGAMVIGAVTTDAFRKIDSEVLSSAESALLFILNEMTLEQQAASLLEREKLLKEFIFDSAGGNSLANVYEQAVKTIGRVVNCPLIRLSTVDTEGKFLSSQALVNYGNSAARVPENGHLILSLLPWHRTVWDNGNTVIINCASSEKSMTAIETMQIFAPGVKRAAIVPIKFAERVYGMISLAEESQFNESSLTESNINFVETIGAVLGAVTNSQMCSKDILSDFATIARSELVDAGQRRSRSSQMKSSLSSIIGAVEMLTGDTVDDVRRRRFLSIIDKSAQRISECLTE